MGTDAPHDRLTEVQREVLGVLAAVYPSALTTQEVAQRRTGDNYDGQRSYRALRQLEAKGIVAGFRISPLDPVGWAVIGGYGA